MGKTKVAYDEKAIKTLDALEHIRLRTGMYVGRLGDGSHPQDGIYILLKEVIDNSIDEFIMGEGKKIVITRNKNEVTVRDYGRGIPLGKVIECVSKINTGGKYSDDVFQFSVGLNGVGTKAVNALSSEFEVISYRKGEFVQALFRQGKLISKKEGKKAKEKNGTFIRFVPDDQIFKKYRWDEEYIEWRLNFYAYLNSGLTILYNKKEYKSEEGLKDLLAAEIGNEPTLYETVYFKENKIEFALTHTTSYGENYFSFVNGQYTINGGTHESAFKMGILKGINEYGKTSFTGEDVREGLVGAIAIKMKDPVFESQTKNKLGSTEVKTKIVDTVRQQTIIWLQMHPQDAKKLLEKIKINEKLRKELATIKKEAKERAKKVAIRIPKLIDCKIHFDDLKQKRREESSIFLTEGDSAGGAMIQARDVHTQAIFSLKGKPLNVYGLKKDTVYKNEELYNIMSALGVEDGLDGLRYAKVIIATDADVDGMHIRNLLLTYFLHYFEDLVFKGHVYILETPLFRVRNKKETIYCYSEEERNKAVKSLGVNPEVTRFKGLGEISPLEFKQFIGDDMRLIPVQISSMGRVHKILEFLMGKNTPERKAFIIKNLSMEVL
ncbi:MAG: type IIA DNA topoisomerase subunit B [Spirochaetales bacterium]|nr:type IIA DNA topoisomerase subunit B [Spirochaetales bacterium]